MPFVTVQEFKNATLIEHNEQDAAISLSLGAAQEIVLLHIKDPDAVYTPDDAPERLKAATILVCSNLMFAPQAEPVSQAVKDILVDLRDPTLA